MRCMISDNFSAVCYFQSDNEDGNLAIKIAVCRADILSCHCILGAGGLATNLKPNWH